MNKRISKIWIFAGIVPIIAGLFYGGLSLFGILPGQGGALYKDPQGRFTMRIDPNWEQIATDGSYPHFKLADPPVQMYLLVLPAETIEDGYAQAFEKVGFDPALLKGGATMAVGDWEAYGTADSAGLTYGLAGRVVGEHAYIFMVKGDKPGVDPENPILFRTLNSVKITGDKPVVYKSYAEVEALIQKKVDSLAGSVSVAVLHKGKIVYAYAYGDADPVKGVPADTRSIFHFGSMTKPFTAVALMQLVEKGKVDLDAWAGKYIPEFPQRLQVTVRQLLTHSACMPDNGEMVDDTIAFPGESFAPYADIFALYIKDNPQTLCEPGKVAQYANIHYLALARIVEEVSGESFESYVVEHILKPLEMDSTNFQVVEADERYAKGQVRTDKVDKLITGLNAYRGPGMEAFILQKGEPYSTMDNFRILPPWGGLFGTPSDITHFLQMFMDKGRYGDAQILKPDTVAAMLKMQKSTDGSPLGVGLSWWFGKDSLGEFYYHTGGGTTIDTAMRFHPKQELGVVVMGSVNDYHASQIADALVSAWENER